MIRYNSIQFISVLDNHMNMLSKKAHYALTAMICLARHYGEGPILISKIAETEKIPKKFLNLILLEMKNHGLLSSRKGKEGGYSLAKPPEAIDLATIIRLMNGPLAPVLCVSALARQKCDVCVDESVCGLKPTMKAVRDATIQILVSTTLADIIACERDLADQVAADRGDAR